MKRKRMTKRIAAIILAAVMMIPTHVTSFAADASAQNTAGQEAGNATSGDSQTTQSENQAATQNDSSTTGTDTNAGSTGTTTTQNSSASDTKNSTTNNSASDAQSSTTNTSASDAQNSTTNNSASDAQSSTTTNSDSTNTSTSGTTDNVTGGVTVEDDKKSTENVTGDVIVDENNDKVEIKKDDKPYLALGADLSDDQKNIVLSLMGIDPVSEQVTPQMFLLLSQTIAYAADVLEEAGQKEVFTVGTSQLLKLPEFRDADKAHQLMSFLSDSKENLPVPDEGPMKILIGPENVSEALQDTSVVVASYDIGNDMRGLIGVVGPTRMDYGTVAARLSGFAEGLTRLFGKQELPPKEDAKE